MQQQPKDPEQDHGDISHVDLNQSPEEILEYWTPERMAEAKPREVVMPDPEPSDPAGPDFP